MKPRRIAVYEQRSFLTAGLERQWLEVREWTFRWFPHSEDFFTGIASFAFDLAVLDCTRLDSRSVTRIIDLATQVPFLAVLARDDFELECLLREAGVRAVYTRLDGIERIAEGLARLLEDDRSIPDRQRHSGD